MADYRAPLEDIRFALETTAGLKDWSSYPGFEEAGEDLALAVLDEAGKLANEVVGPTNRDGDLIGAKLADSVVTTPDSFKPLHAAYVEGGWMSLPFSQDYGGQGLPGTLAMAVNEMITSANMAYSLSSMLTSGAIEALSAHASDELKAIYLEKLITSEWTGTMNLTEPQAGSDVGAVRTKAEPVGDGTYRITGQKIYITWGEHDLSDNIVHLVLARTPGAPEGTRGISMFVVPKFFVNEDGSLGARNDVRCAGMEHKLGIHGSPTCVMAFGENGDCRGWLVGEENRGMRNMFTMMNHARVGVGLQGVAISERAYQDAAAFALERVQSAEVGSVSREPVTIVKHPDVRRMLMTMRAYTEATRAIVYKNGWAMDRSHHASDAEARRLASAEADLLTPISKAFATDVGVEMSSIAVQVYGGMGFVEESGVAQHYRDSRIAPIYEGTNGIQAMDLVGRKLNMDGGEHWKRLIEEMRVKTRAMDRALAPSKDTLAEGIETLDRAAHALFANGFERIIDTAAASSPFLRLFGSVLGAHLLAEQAMEAERRLAASDGNPGFLRAKIVTARFFIEQILPSAIALVKPIEAGSDLIMALGEEDFLRVG